MTSPKYTAFVRVVSDPEPTTRQEAATASGKTRGAWAYAPRILASLAIALGFVWLFKRGGLPLIPSADTLSAVHAGPIAAYVLATSVAIYFRVHRWLPLLRPVAPDISETRVVGVGLIGIATIMLAPLRMGEAARPYLLARDGKVTFFQALGAAGAERVVDGLVLTLTAALALTLSTPISPLPDHLGDVALPVSIIPRAVYVAAAVFTGGAVALTVFYGARGFARKVTMTLLNPISTKLAGFVTGTLERLADGLNVLGSPENRLRFLGETLLCWSCQFIGQWLLMRGCGIEASFAQACVTLGVLGLGVIVPAGPGLFGAFQIGTYSGLALYFPVALLRTSGAAMAFISYATQLLAMLVALGLGFWMLRQHKRALLVESPERS
ncbi:MAG TPA: lysylphosphatidylglycerol synthase transmembrane domain-containing protein [Polyangiaceae bacterium]|nr:lysylphosphatidylglycerol synthase transmembrane domain-containing protein [Polyangiaceae bacterium]